MTESLFAVRNSCPLFKTCTSKSVSHTLSTLSAHGSIISCNVQWYSFCMFLYCCRRVFQISLVLDLLKSWLNYMFQGFALFRSRNSEVCYFIKLTEIWTEVNIKGEYLNHSVLILSSSHSSPIVLNLPQIVNWINEVLQQTLRHQNEDPPYLSLSTFLSYCLC